MRCPGQLRVKQRRTRMSKSGLLCPKLRTSKGQTEFCRDGPKRDLGSASFTLAAPASKSNVVQETGCVSENMSTILLVMPFTIST